MKTIRPYKPLCDRCKKEIGYFRKIYYCIPYDTWDPPEPGYTLTEMLCGKCFRRSGSTDAWSDVDVIVTRP